MEEVVLIISVLGIMAFGFFLMKRLDSFLASNQAAIQKNSCYEEQTLRIAFTTPSVVSDITEALVRFSRHFPNAKVCLYTGDTDTIVRMFSSGEVDIALLPASIESDALIACDRIDVFLRQDGLSSNTAGLELLPLDGGLVSQCIAWKKVGGLADDLVIEIERELHTHGGSVSEKVI